jgi:glutathione synthase/RimK-type ligase-like ATP-grasp enzyme
VPKQEWLCKGSFFLKIFVVVNNPKRWPLQLSGVEVIQARKYLTEPTFSRISGARVFNLSRSYRYQSLGYYVSLLATARGHRPIPDITTIRDLQMPAIIRLVSDELDTLMQKSLAPIKAPRFTLSIYFGQNTAKRYARLSRSLFNLFPAPMLRAEFAQNEKWQLQNIKPIGVSEVPEAHRDFLVQAADEFFSSKFRTTRKQKPARWYMAMLHRPNDPCAPSNTKALQRFIRAGRKYDIDVSLITRDDFGRLAEFDALFIRETTNVTDHTFRFSRCAETEGLVVIDDSGSIIRCANKVYLAEMMARFHVRTPRTLIVHKDNLDLVFYELGLPCVLKKPDSSFSQGVIKVNTRDELETEALKMLARSELIIAQEFLPTEFDWRIGILNQQPLYACRYYMAHNHWQIINHRRHGRHAVGNSETLRIEDAPEPVVRQALRAAHHIGNGLYGVDLKQSNGKIYVIEVNDNPNIDHGVEDEALEHTLYEKIMQVFAQRLESRFVKG